MELDKPIKKEIKTFYPNGYWELEIYDENNKKIKWINSLGSIDGFK